jgi:Ca2+-binding RTX toxin-like protein
MRALTVTALTATLLWVPASPSHAAPPRCHGQVATIVGTPGDDHLVGTDGPDVIVGLGGADRIEGLGGDDVICGGAHRGVGDRQTRGDDIDGGPGSDWIDPGRDRRRVSAQGNPDVLRYTHAASGIRADLSGRTGTVTVGADTDTIRVAEGLWVLGSQHDDVIVGTRFDDDLEGNRGADLLQGGPGDDGLDELDGIWSRSDRDADRKEGGPGDDSLQATGGADVLDGGEGDDFLHEQGYALGTSMLGGPGDDDLFAYYDEAADRLLDAGEGVDLFEVQWWGSDDPTVSLVVDAATGQVRSSVPGQAVLTAAGVERWAPSVEQPVTFLGTPGPDWVDGRMTDHLTAQTFAGDDVVKGSDYSDTLDVGDGDDRVDGRRGRDTCLGAERVRRCESTGAPG